MKKLLFIVLPLALVACSSEPAEQESADDFASRIGQNGEALDPARPDPDAPNTANEAPPAGADLTSLQKLGDIGGVNLGPREGGCTLMVGKDEMIIAAGMKDGAIPGKAVVRVGDSLTLADGSSLSYDVLVLATGPQLAFDEIPGLGPRRLVFRQVTPRLSHHPDRRHRQRLSGQ